MRTLILGEAPESALDEPFVFAGPWCFAHCPDRLEHNWIFPPEPFADPDNLETAARQARRLVGAAAGHLGEHLNSRHRTKLSPAFWDTALAPWLSTAVEVMVDRLWRLEQLVRLHGDESLRLPLPARQCPRPADSRAFLLHGVLNPRWNHWLFSRLLEHRIPPLWKPEALVDAGAHQPASGNAKNSPEAEPFLRAVARRMVFALPFPRMKGFRLRDSLRLSMTLRGNTDTANRTLPLAAFAELSAAPLPVSDAALFALLEELIPQALLDPLPSPWFRRCTTRVASVAAADDDRLRLKLAWHMEQGGRLIHVQHGGEYGYVRSSAAYAAVEYRHHTFVSWGWRCDAGTEHRAVTAVPQPSQTEQAEQAGPDRSSHDFEAAGHSEKILVPPPHGLLPDKTCHVTPLPHPHLQALCGKHREEEETLLFVGTEMALIPYNLKSTRRTVQQMEYRAGKDRFLKALPPALLDKTLYRPYFDLPCTLPDAPWVLGRHPAVRRCDGPLEPHLLRCRLLVLDHLGTTLAQALAADVPFVVFHNPAHQPVTADNETLLNRLAEAGILFTQPAAAAAHCAAVWDNVDAWWNLPTTRKGRDTFARRHALTADGDVLPLWRQFLCTV